MYLRYWHYASGESVGLHISEVKHNDVLSDLFPLPAEYASEVINRRLAVLFKLLGHAYAEVGLWLL